MDVLLSAPKYIDLIYDVGMHQGEDAEFYLRKGFRVVGVEANPDMVLLCLQRLQPYVQSGQLTIVKGAVAESSVLRERGGKVAFYINERKSHWGTANLSWVERNKRLGTQSHQIEVDGLDFEAILLEHGIPHYLKIDIEGSDTICLKALKRFRERPDFVSIESSQASFACIRDELDLLESLGYDRFLPVEQSQISTQQTPPQPAMEGGYAAQLFRKGATGLFGAELPEPWMSKAAVSRRYRAIWLGYYLFGVEGVLNGLRFPLANRFRSIVKRLCSAMTGAAVPGWYDTHARHSATTQHIDDRWPPSEAQGELLDKPGR